MAELDLRQVAEAALAECADPALAATEYEFARALVAVATYAGTTLAAAESLTGGMLAELLTSVPGASKTFRGAVVAYTEPAKQRVLEVPAELLKSRGPIDPEVALQMATGAAKLLDADFGLGCTGVAGPDPVGSHPVGEVHIALFYRPRQASRTKSLQLGGSRDDIRVQTCIALLGLALDVLVPLAGLNRETPAE